MSTRNTKSFQRRIQSSSHTPRIPHPGMGPCLSSPSLPGVSTGASPAHHGPLYHFGDNFTQKHLSAPPFPLGSRLISRIWIKGLELVPPQLWMGKDPAQGSILQKPLQRGIQSSSFFSLLESRQEQLLEVQEAAPALPISRGGSLKGFDPKSTPRPFPALPVSSEIVFPWIPDPNP